MSCYGLHCKACTAMCGVVMVEHRLHRYGRVTTVLRRRRTRNCEQAKWCCMALSLTSSCDQQQPRYHEQTAITSIRYWPDCVQGKRQSHGRRKARE